MSSRGGIGLAMITRRKALCLPLAATALRAAPQQRKCEEVRRIPGPEANQGVAADDDSLYATRSGRRSCAPRSVTSSARAKSLALGFSQSINHTFSVFSPADGRKVLDCCRVWTFA